MFCIVLEDRIIVRDGLTLDQADALCAKMERASGEENLMVMRTDRALKMGMRKEIVYA
jgi:hypothetical protein